MKEEVMVSICCTTYNQEAYIKQTLDSFFMQKTNFPFEIIIHDDASTDNTANIIKEYEKRYPDIIKPIYQTENQYSKKVKILPIVFAKSSGKYIAICEGDDYWCDEYKLQKQFDFMEKNPSCSLVTMGTKLLNDRTGEFKIKKQPYKGSRYYTVDEIIEGGGGLFSTASMFFQTKYVRELPQIYEVAPVGDYPLTIHFALCGDVYYINDIASVYRVNAKGSWSVRMQQGDIAKKQQNLYKGFNIMFDVLNKQTNYQYEKSISYFLLQQELNLHTYINDRKALKNKKFKVLYKTGSIKDRIKNFIKIKLTFIYTLYKKKR